jgi:hypothetical protein
MFNKFSRINVKIIAELGFCARTFDPFQDIGTCEILESGTCKTLESGTRDDLESGICEIRESAEVQIRRLRCTRIFMYEGFGNQEEAKSKTLPQRSGLNV